MCLQAARGQDRGNFGRGGRRGLENEMLDRHD